MSSVADRLLRWFDQHGRHDLPWQKPRNAYRVWLSEVMLQQTQVATVTGYFERFVTSLPTLADLAQADEDTVLALWSGLGYYRRARFLHQAARLCVERHDGKLPEDFAALLALPGIGKSTAGAILAQAHGQRFAILDGNVKRVLARYHGIHGYPSSSPVEKQLWDCADRLTPTVRVADYTQAIMDLGATVCRRSAPRCDRCPLADDCVAQRSGLTADLPGRKPAKHIPTRATIMLILRDGDGRILLERRGPQGVWAGLWSLPEAPDPERARQMARRHASLKVMQPLEAFTHTFSHYRLEIEPQLFDHATAVQRIEDDAGLGWYDMERIAALGLPAPVRKLLLSLKIPVTLTSVANA